MVAVRKDIVLVGQIGAAGVDQVDARQPVLTRDLLCTQVFLYGNRIVGAAFDRRVVAHDHALAARDFADTSDDAGRRGVVVVHAVGRELRQLEKRSAGVEQHLHAIARQQLAASDVFAACLLAPTGSDSGDLVFQIGDLSAHRLHIGLNFVATRVKSCLEHTHGRMLVPGFLRPSAAVRTSHLRSSRVQRGHQSRKCVSLGITNSSSCGGLIAVPASIACA